MGQQSSDPGARSRRRHRAGRGLLRAADSTGVLKSGSDNGSSVGGGVVVVAVAGGGRKAKQHGGGLVHVAGSGCWAASYFRDKH